MTGSTRARRETAPISPVEVVVRIGKDDVLTGTLYAHRRCGTESATFSYTPEYLRAPQAYPLDPALPLVTGAQQTPVGPAMFGAFTGPGAMTPSSRYR